MTALKPCRFCGETEKLSVDPGVWETLWAIDETGQVIRDEKGQPTTFDEERFADGHYVDQVNCQFCEAMMPLRIWNSTPEFMARMRTSIAIADAEYDDDGVWLGPRTAVPITPTPDHRKARASA